MIVFTLVNLLLYILITNIRKDRGISSGSVDKRYLLFCGWGVISIDGDYVNQCSSCSCYKDLCCFVRGSCMSPELLRDFCVDIIYGWC